MGLKFQNNNYSFSIFAPDVQSVILCVFDNPEDESYTKFTLRKVYDEIWEVNLNEDLLNKYYAYKIVPKNFSDEIENLPLVLDPYATCVCTYTTYKNPRLAKITNTDYDWKTKNFTPVQHDELIIYETHLRDLTIDPSAKSNPPGTYKGFCDPKGKGGINYIKSLGINAVEFLPVMEFGYMELPFKVQTEDITNTWNPYERNHWGYMTANYFSPAAYYSLPEKNLPRDKWIGATGEQINDFKEVVDELHSNGIAVILDVVYNHLSEYETGNLKEISKNYFFRTDQNGYLLSDSFCGNDLKTENHYVRKLVLDSLIHWLTEYKVDGFRFDLGNIIDDDTLKIIIDELKKIKPDIILTAEPWGGGYAPSKFSDFGYASWNDKFRNGIKGENPNFGLGWIFGKWYGNNNKETIKNYILGSVFDYQFGLFNEHYHSVNYLEAHDGYTLSDFIRIGNNDVLEDEVIFDPEENVKLTDEQSKLNKLAAMFLFVSKGIVMIHSGQEFARSKVIFNDPDVDDPNTGRLDHNSYEKDNPTNWINFKHAKINSDLIEYYKGLIEIRKKYKIIRSSEKSKYTFYNLAYTNLAFAFEVRNGKEKLFVVLNADPTLTAYFDLPKGKWKVLADKYTAGIKPKKDVSTSVSVPPTSGYILVSDSVK